MKVILLHDVAKVGKKYEVKDVADGYAANALIPQGRAETATPIALRRLNKIKAEEEAKKAALESLIAAEVGKVNGEEVLIVRPVNEQGHLFAAVHETDIAKAILDKYKVSFEPRHIKLESALKKIGSERVQIQVGDKKGAITVTITADESTKEQPKK